MKNRVIVIVFAALIIGVLILFDFDVFAKKDKVAINVLSYSVEENIVAVSIQNDSGRTIYFTPFYKLQKQVLPGLWRDLRCKGDDVHADLYSCLPDSGSNFGFDLPYYDYPVEKPGVYRMVIRYSFDESPGSLKLRSMYGVFEVAD